MKYFFSIDPGTEKSGICILTDGHILSGNTVLNELLFDLILSAKSEYSDLEVLIEDIAPYSVKMGQDVINTVKFIGELSYRLKIASIDFVLVLRWNVKRWVFENYPDEVIPEINQRIITNDMKNKNGDYRQPTFIFVNDRNVLKAMKKHWGIEKPKPGKRNPIGLSGHAWQALALGTYYTNL